MRVLRFLESGMVILHCPVMIWKSLRGASVALDLKP